jgi:hypothetical protein
MPAIDRDSRWSNIHHALNRMEGRISRDPARGMDLSDCQIVRSYVQELEADTAALRAQLEEEQRKVRDGVSPCGHYRVFAMPCVLEDGTEQPYCMQCDRDELQTELAEARARLALPPQAQEPEK